MSFHNKPDYQIPELIEALKAHRLPHDTPSQLADSFRIGWMACRERAQADSVPAVSDLPPLPAPDLRDVGTKPQEIKEFLKGYATEYARTAIAARAPAGAEESRTIPDREIPGIVEKALQELEGLVKYATSTYGHWNMRRAKGALSDLEWWARRKLAAHAQAADSVQEDAALWHWLAEYLVGTRTDLDDEIVACETVNDLRKLVESAIKQGEKQ